MTQNRDEIKCTDLYTIRHGKQTPIRLYFFTGLGQ